MRISIVGTGYVGLVTGACFAELGNEVVCVDVSEERVEQINGAVPPIYEEGLEELLERHVPGGRLRATTDLREAVESTEVSFISVGTPSGLMDYIDLQYVEKVSRDIGEILGGKEDYHLVVVKSTVVPGTTEHSVLPSLERYSGKMAGRDFGVAMNPEFLREGSAVEDFMHPDRVVLGTIDDSSTEILLKLYSDFSCPTMTTTPKTAEMIKYATNSFLATKISFINDIGNICKLLGIDSNEVARGLGMDSRVSPKFLKAGIGFGGSCLSGEDYVCINSGRGMEVLKFEDVFEKYVEDGEITAPVHALSFCDRGSRFSKVLAFTKREYSGTLLRIKTSMGKMISTTPRHPFLVQENGALMLRYAADLREGDYIPVITSMPNGGSARRIDLIQELQGSSIGKIKVRPISKKFSEYKREIRAGLKGKGWESWRIYDFFRKNYMRLEAYLEVEDKIPIKREDLYIFTSKGRMTYVKAVVPLDAKFWRLVGYYLSEGCTSHEAGSRGERVRVQFHFNASEKEYIADIRGLLQELGVRTSVVEKGSAISILASSRVLGYLFEEVLNCGRDSYTARIPQAAYLESEECKMALLSGLFRGDGHVAFPGHTRAVVLDYGTISYELAQGMILLLHSLGVVPSYKKSWSLKSTDYAHFIRVSAREQVEKLKSIFPRTVEDKISSRLKSYKRAIKPTGHKNLFGFGFVKVRKVEKVPYEGYVYSMEVERDHTFVAGSGIITHNCFPKDVKALVGKAKEVYYRPAMLNAALELNEVQPLKIIELLEKRAGRINGIDVAVLGLAFKPGTDDMREAPSIKIVTSLLIKGARIHATDPKALGEARKIFGEHERLNLCRTPEEAVEKSRYVLIVTEWEEFRREELYRGKVVVDGRGIEEARAAEHYEGVCW